MEMESDVHGIITFLDESYEETSKKGDRVKTH
jgi:hypothetical protein